MEQTSSINSSLEKISLIENLPIEFSINDRRTIRFSCPTIKDINSLLDFKLFITILSLDEDKAKEFNIKFNFDASTSGKIVQGLLLMTDYSVVLSKYFLKYIENSVYENNAILVEGEKVLSYEYDYIIETFFMSLGRKEFQQKKEEEEKIDPQIAAILKLQKQAEEKLNQAKRKKQEKEKGLQLEEILLAISYEFGISIKELMDKTYFGISWYFAFVGKVDAHKLNQMILSSGMSKEKKYSYWLNK
jgi:hypothetical protein